jgi:hypothetical protein
MILDRLWPPSRYEVKFEDARAAAGMCRGVDCVIDQDAVRGAGSVGACARCQVNKIFCNTNHLMRF